MLSNPVILAEGGSAPGPYGREFTTPQDTAVVMPTTQMRKLRLERLNRLPKVTQPVRDIQDGRACPLNLSPPGAPTLSFLGVTMVCGRVEEWLYF